MAEAAVIQQPQHILRPTDIVDDVRQVLRDANPGKGTSPSGLTSYQILDRLPAEIRGRAIAERGRGGRGADTHFAATSLVMLALRILINNREVEVTNFDTGGMQMEIAGVRVSAGNAVCGIYRLLA